MWRLVCDTAWKIFIDAAGHSSGRRNKLLWTWLTGASAATSEEMLIKSCLNTPTTPQVFTFFVLSIKMLNLKKQLNEAEAVGWTDEIKTLNFFVMLKLHQHPGVCLCVHLHTVNISAFNWIQFSFHFVRDPPPSLSSWVHSQAASRRASANARSIKSCPGFVWRVAPCVSVWWEADIFEGPTRRPAVHSRAALGGRPADKHKELSEDKKRLLLRPGGGSLLSHYGFCFLRDLLGMTVRVRQTNISFLQLHLESGMHAHAPNVFLTLF